MNIDENQGTIESEVRKLGDNLKRAFQQAWQSEELNQLQEEIEISFSQLGKSLDEFINEMTSGPTGRRIQADFQNAREKIESGEAEQKIYHSLLHVLRQANKGIEKLTKVDMNNGTQVNNPDLGDEDE